MRAFRAVAGSWNTTEMTRPMVRRSAAVRLVTSVPLKNTRPSVGFCRPHITFAVVDLPQPDSPTMPRVSPGMSLRVRPRTAWTLLGLNSDPGARLERDLDVVEEDDGGVLVLDGAGVGAGLDSVIY